MKNGEVALVFTTVDETTTAISDSSSIRKTAIAQRITYQTTVAGAEAAIEGMKHLHQIHVYDVQSLHRSIENAWLVLKFKTTGACSLFYFAVNNS